MQVERPKLIRRNTFTKLEGDILTETTNAFDFKHYENVEKTTKIQRKEDHIILGDETFQVNLILTYSPSPLPISMPQFWAYFTTSKYGNVLIKGSGYSTILNMNNICIILLTFQ